VIAPGTARNNFVSLQHIMSGK